MEYLLDVRFEDKNYNAVIHLVTTLTAQSDEEAQVFVNELIEGFKRKKITVLHGSYTRIDHDPEFRKSQYEYYKFCLRRATATVKIEQFIFENPDQTKSLVDNLTERLMNGENSTAKIGKEYNIPIRVTEKETRNQIEGEFFFQNIEHLIPKQ